jgi:hypothetical protein
MKRLHALWAAVGTVFLATPASATVASYTVVGPTAATYSTLSGGTSVSFSSTDDGLTAVPLPSGFVFKWFDSPVTQVGIDTNGFISFGATTLTSCGSGGCYSARGLPVTQASSFSTSPLDAVYVWWTDLSVSSPAHVQTGTEVVNGVTVFAIDYQNVAPLSASGTFSAKVRLYPDSANSRIEVIYGPATGSLTSTQAMVGLQNGTFGATALWAAGLPCSLATSSGGSTCTTPDFPANQMIRYEFADKPDLDWGPVQINSVTAGPDAGDPVALTVGAQLRNDGTQATDGGAFDVALYLSQSPTLDGGATLLTTATVSQVLAKNGALPLALSATFPRPSVGKYYFVVRADTTDAINEIDEDNNLASAVVYMGTDLSGTITAPSGGDVGQPVPVEVRVINQGVDTPTQAFNFKVYLSTDRTLDSSDVQVYSGTIDPSHGELPYDQTLQLVLPANVPSTDVYWLLDIDPPSASSPSGAVVEADESNNRTTTAGTTHANLPDLNVVSVEVRSIISPYPLTTTGYFSQPLRVRVTLQNIGPATLRNADIGIYLSGGLGASVITGYDQQVDDPIVAALAPGGTVVLEQTITIPELSNMVDTGGNPVPWTEGDFYIGAIGDSAGAIGELSKLNNIAKAGPIHLRPAAPDFVTTTLNVPVARGAGQSVPVFRVIRNQGNKDNTGSAAVACPYQYYLSSNNIITTEDRPLRIVVGGVLYDQGAVKLGINAENIYTDLVELPADVAPGTYHLGLLLNPGQLAPEIDYSNDAADGSNTIVVSSGALQVTTAALPPGLVGVPYQVALGASGGSGLSWVLDPGAALPDGLTLSSAGLLSGTPTRAGLSTFSVVVQAAGVAARRAFTLQITPVSGTLQVVTHALPSAVAGRAFSSHLAAVGGATPYAWALVSGSTLPAGVTLTADGQVRGTPPANATTAPSTVQVSVTDSLGTKVLAAVTFRVVSSSSLRITTETLPVATVGANYPPAGTDNVVTSVHGTAPFTWAVVEGSMPPGLQLVNAGDHAQVAGKPSASGLFPFTLRVTDASGQSDDHDFSIATQPHGLALTAEPLPSVAPGASYDADLSGLAARAVWSLYAGALPPGITLDAAGHLGGTCDAKAAPGHYTFLVQALDVDGAAGLVAETITVTAPDKKIPAASGCSSTSGLSLLPLVGLWALLSRRRLGALGLGALALGAPLAARADYTVTTTPTPYAAVGGGSPIATGRSTAGTVTLPFTFYFYGQPYTTVSAGTDGYLRFGSGAATSGVPSFTSGSVIAGWWDALDVASFSASLTSQEDGTAPHRTVTFQWTNVDSAADEDNFEGPNNFNFQIVLHEEGTVELAYGSHVSAGFSQVAAAAGISNGTRTQYALSCSPTSRRCSQDDWPTDTRVTFLPGADLVAGTLSAPADLFTGSSAQLSLPVTNLGGLATGSFTVRFVLSADQVLGGTNDTIIGTQSISGLQPGASATATQTLAAGNRPPGTYYLFGVVDPAHAVTEETTSNNIAGPTRIDVSTPSADLQVTTVAAAAHGAAPGDTLHVDVTVTNAGTVASPAVPVNVYLSTYAGVSQSDLLLGSATTAALSASGTATVTVTAVLPATLLPGTYTVGAIADPDQTLLESNELNNAGVDATPLVVSTDTLALVAPLGNKLPDTSAGAVFGYQFSATGGDGNYSFAATADLPPGLSLSTSGALTGRPSTAKTTPYAVTLQVDDGAGHTASGTYTLRVTASQVPLTLLTQDLADATYDQPYSGALSAMGGTPPYAWTLVGEGKLPAGMTLTGDGSLVGAPHEAPSTPFHFRVQAQDAAGATVSGNLQLVVAPPDRLRPANSVLPDAKLGEPYEAVLGYAGNTGGIPNFAFPYCPPNATCVTRFPAVPTDGTPASTSALPRGLYFSCDQSTSGDVTVYLTSKPRHTGPCAIPDDGTAPGVPTEAGAFSIPAQITDALANAVQVVYTLKVGFGQGISITSARLPDALTHHDYSYTLQAVSPESPAGSITWSIACSERDANNQPVDPCPENLPPGLSLDPSGAITGKATDTAAKTYTFLVRAADSQGRVSVQAESITAHPSASDTSTKSSGCGSTSSPATLLPLLGLALGLRRSRRPSHRND